jgi:hypothetical protein
MILDVARIDTTIGLLASIERDCMRWRREEKRRCEWTETVEATKEVVMVETCNCDEG